MALWLVLDARTATTSKPVSGAAAADTSASLKSAALLAELRVVREACEAPEFGPENTRQWPG